MLEHPFAQYVRILGKGKTGSRSLDAVEAEAAMTMILSGEVEDAQIGAFLMLLRVKEESHQELAGFVRAVRQQIKAPAVRADLDWASYAGKRRQLPWYLLAALALADSGTRVFMHGAAGHTPERIYSEQVLSALGEAPAHDWASVSSQLDRANFAFMPLSAMCPPLQKLMDLRQLFGLRSPVHTLSRLLNPLSCQYSMQSIFHPAYGDSHQQAAALLGQPHAAVFKGEAGEAERKPEASCHVKYVHDGALSETSWPRLLNGRQAKLEHLDIEQLRRVWTGDSEDDYGSPAILGSIAIALQLQDASRDTDDCLSAAADIWNNRNTARLSLPRS